LSQARLLDFLKKRVQGDLKFHHEFRISIADCPNACSQVQIKDVGIIGAATPRKTDAPCSACGACSEICKEDAIRLSEADELCDIDLNRCVHCGGCMTVCPTGAIETQEKGYRMMIGGKLGRHPKLAVELPCIYQEDTVIEMIHDFIAFYKNKSDKGQRFSHLLTDSDIERFSKKWSC
jgi:anaerobic sulfite reductase subunit C